MNRNEVPWEVSRRDVLRAAGLSAGILVGGGSLIACTADKPQPGQSAASSIDVGSANVFLDLDPHVASTIGTIAINNLFLFEGLYTQDSHNHEGYQPELADGPLQKVDDVTYRCGLRKDATFHDGSLVTADDVVFSFDRMRKPDTGSLLTSFLDAIKAVTKVDERTVQFTLSYPTAVAMDRIALVKIMSKKNVTGTDKKVRSLQPVGSGPYRVTKAVSNDRVELAAYAGYNGPRKASIDKVTSRVMLDGNARVSALSSARVQVIEEVPYPSIASLGKTNGVKVEAVPSCGYSAFLFHCGKPPFNDKRVRQAVMYAIDRDAIAKSVFFGQATSAKNLLCEENPFFTEPTTVYGHDPEKARRLLAEAGYSRGLKLEMLISNAGYILPQGAIVQQNLKDVGIDVTLKPGETEANFKYVTDGSYSFYLTLGDVSIFSWDPIVQLSFLYKGAIPKALLYWQNAATKQVEQLLDQAGRAKSDEERKAIVAKVTDILADEIPAWPIHHRSQPTGWRDTLTDFRPIASAGFDLAGAKIA